MTLKQEIERLKADYPHLSATFESVGTFWRCSLSTHTVMFGDYGIACGEGVTKRKALLKSRASLDDQKAAREAAAVESEKLEQERIKAESAREKILDDLTYSMF